MGEPTPKSVYVLHGRDGFLLDAARREVVARIIGDSDPQVALTTFDADAELPAVLDELRTTPFLAPRRAVIIRDADGFVTAHRDKLEEYLKSPSRNSSLVLAVGTWLPNSKLGKQVAAVGEVIDCTPPEQASLGGWIRKAAGQRGKKIDAAAAQLLGAWVGADLGSLSNELDKLALYVGQRDTIAAQDVATLVTATAGVDAFDLTNAIAEGDVAAALNVLGTLLQKRGEEFRTLGLISWHLRRALAAQQALLDGKSLQQAMPRMPWDRQKSFGEMLKRRPLARLQGDFRRLIAVDLAMKSGTEPHAAMQQLVIELCV